MAENNTVAKLNASTEPSLEDHQKWPIAKKADDLTGKRFGKLVVVGDPRRYTANNQQVRTYWHCACDCTGESFVSASSLKRGLTNSCGCDMRVVLMTHGLVQLCIRTYNSWNSMTHRCTNPKYSNYDLYGGSGVLICERWGQYVNFIGDMGLRPEGTTIDRYHPDWQDGDPPLPYSPSTCRWATPREQANNRRSNVLIEYAGQNKTIAQWARATGLAERTISYRISAGWAVDKSLTQPSRKNKTGGSK